MPHPSRHMGDGTVALGIGRLHERANWAHRWARSTRGAAISRPPGRSERVRLYAISPILTVVATALSGVGEMTHPSVRSPVAGPSPEGARTMTPTRGIHLLNGSILSPRGIGLVAAGARTWRSSAVGWNPARAEAAEEAAEPEQPQVAGRQPGRRPERRGRYPERVLNTGRSGVAQAFTTGAEPDGYALGSLGLVVSSFEQPSSVADHLQVSIHAVAEGSGPGEALCTLEPSLELLLPGPERVRRRRRATAPARRWRRRRATSS